MLNMNRKRLRHTATRQLVNQAYVTSPCLPECRNPLWLGVLLDCAQPAPFVRVHRNRDELGVVALERLAVPDVRHRNPITGILAKQFPELRCDSTHILNSCCAFVRSSAPYAPSVLLLASRCCRG